MIITAGGENIPYLNIENMVKKELPVLSNVVLVGDKRKYLTILVTLKTIIDLNTGAPKDDFAEETKMWLQSLNLDYKKLSDLLAAGPDKSVLTK